jgi:phenylalanyl-tRNA synthetase beta chain
MKVTYNWLKKYVNIDIPAEDMAKMFTMSGSEVGSLEKVRDDVVMEMEITANRPDCLNMIGMAREASAVLEKELVLPDFSVSASEGGPLIITDIRDKEMCPRYTARVISGVEVKPVHRQIGDFITAVGMREVNNIVDITNYCLMETGQPLHAFDLDKIKGNRIIIRKARKEEKITTIDDIERTLEEHMLVIADEKGPIAIAGVMGGKDTEVTYQTKNILLESAYFNALSIRRTARKLGLSSDASYRFERGVDKAMIEKASNRASSLIAMHSGGEIKDFFTAGECVPEEPILSINTEKAGRVLGICLEDKQVAGILSRLGMDVLKTENSTVTVKAPSYREDVRKEIDLVEEVARVFGYDKIPEKVEKIIPQPVRKEYPRKVMEKLRVLLSGYGLNEIMTYSLVNEKAVSNFPGFNKNVVELWNPLSEEHKFLTPQLLDGMMRTIAWNINRGNRDLGFFEIAKIYNTSGKEGYKEIPVVCLGLTGNLRENWKEGNRKADFFDIKGIIENLTRGLNITSFFPCVQMDGFLNAVNIQAGGLAAGFIAQARPVLLREYNIEQAVFLAQIDLESITAKAVLDTRYRPVPRFPFSARDISIVCDKDMSIAEVEAVILSSGEEKVQRVKIVSVYEGDPIPGDKRSVSFSVEYGNPSGTLKDEEIESAHAAICRLIADKLDIEFR